MADSRYPHLAVWAIGEARRRRTALSADSTGSEAPAAGDTVGDAVVLEAESSH